MVDEIRHDNDNVDPNLLAKVGQQEEVIVNLTKKTQASIKSAVIIFIVAIVISVISPIINNIISNKRQDSFVDDYLKTEQIRHEKNTFRKFNDKMLNARQVFQWSGYKKVNTKFGKLNLIKYYAMNLRTYNKIVDKIWIYNDYIGCGANEQFHIPGQIFCESAMNEKAKHKTGEVIKFVGYTLGGMINALWVYREVERIDSGSLFYIRELYQRHPNYKSIFSKWENILKFHYAYMWYLKKKYVGRWDCIFTAFNQGEGRVDTWDIKKLDRVPNQLLSKKHDLWLRLYYTSVLEVSHAINSGKLQRMSRAVKIVRKMAVKFGRYRNEKRRYIKTLRYKFRQIEKEEDLKDNLDALNKEFSDYKKMVKKYMDEMSKLNDINYRINESKKAPGIAKAIKRETIDRVTQYLKDIKKYEGAKRRKAILKLFIVIASAVAINISAIFTGIFLLKKIKKRRVRYAKKITKKQ